LLYGELRSRARGELFRHQAVTMQPTTLLYEAWLRLGQRDLQFGAQAELTSYAARAMRGIVIDHIRARMTDKRGNGQDALPYETAAELRTMPDREAEAHRAARLGEGACIAPDAAVTDLARALALAQRLQSDKPYSSHVGRTLAALQRLQLARGQGDEARRMAAAATEHLARARRRPSGHTPGVGRRGTP
jgi:hypothetical protein